MMIRDFIAGLTAGAFLSTTEGQKIVCQIKDALKILTDEVKNGQPQDSADTSENTDG